MKIVTFTLLVAVIGGLWSSNCAVLDDSQKVARIDSYLKDVYPELYSKQYEGDIFLFPGKDGIKNAVRDPVYRWPNGTIPYKISSNFTEEEKTKILTAMKRIQNETCIQFIPREYQQHYVMVEKREKAGCFAVIGYHKNAEVPHPVNLEAPGCLKHQGTIEHELLHIIGLFHEQSRADRDEHVIIYWGNITEEYISNFQKIPEKEATPYNITYDVNSVMHYPRFSFSKNGNETIVYKKDPGMKLGQRVGATQGDLEKVRNMYNCRKKESVYGYGTPEWFFDQVNKFFEEKSQDGKKLFSSKIKQPTLFGKE